MSHSVDLLNIAGVSSKELNKTSENDVVLEPAESKNEEDHFSESSEHASSASDSDNADNDF